MELDFDPLLTDLYLDEDADKKHAIMKLHEKNATIFVVNSNDREEVAEISVPLPINSGSASVNYLTHDEEVQEMVAHPTKNDVVLLKDGSFYLLKNGHEIAFT